MKIDQELIKKVARNARLELTEKELKDFEKQFKEILDYFTLIQDADTKNVKESFHPIEIKNHLREDIIKDSLTQDQALKNARHQSNNYFKGPKAI